MTTDNNPFGVYVGVPALTKPWERHIEPYSTMDALFQRLAEVDAGYVPADHERPCVALGNALNDKLVIGLAGEWWLLRYFDHGGGIYYSGGPLGPGRTIEFRAVTVSPVDVSALIPAVRAQRVIRQWIETREISDEMHPKIDELRAYWRLTPEMQSKVDAERRHAEKQARE